LPAIDLTGRSVLITGGANGLGRAIVERFIKGGASITVLDRSSDGLGELNQAHHDVVTIAGDVTRFDDNVRAVAEAVERFGKLDVFIGNAGIYDHRASLEALPGEALSEAFDELFGVDVKGYMLGAKAALLELRRTRGAIVFTASVSSVAPGFGGVLYIAAKHAVVGLTKQLALELAPEIRVNAVAPGFIPTHLGGISRLGQAAMSADTPDTDRFLLRRAPETEDYVELYALFASQAATPLTGSILLADGGSSIRR
jgi:NAD(P)-dependent dehydrogenase (short-subunit alcohol dehydrogenase family)